MNTSSRALDCGNGRYLPPLPYVRPEYRTALTDRLDRRMRGPDHHITDSNLPNDSIIDRATVAHRMGLLIGNTPLICIEGDDTGGSILAKVESGNPTENHYDRVFLSTIYRLEADGVISPGDTLVEVTSGSGGRAFAWAAALLGYEAQVVVPPELPEARTQDIENLGAQLIFSKPGYMCTASKHYLSMIAALRHDGFIIERHETPDYTVFTAQKDGKRYCFVNHSANELTVKGFDTITDEIHQQMPPEQRVDYVVTIMGNGTSTTALARGMRFHYPHCKIVGVEDIRSPYYFEKKYPGRYTDIYGDQPEYPQHDMFGSSTPGVQLKYGDPSVVDEIRLSEPEVRDLAQASYNAGKPGHEQIGRTSAASLVVARELAAEHPGSNTVVVFYDKAGQYGPEITSAPRAENDIPPFSWSQQKVGIIALLPHTISDAYAATSVQAMS